MLSLGNSYFSNSSFQQGNRKGSPGWKYSELPAWWKSLGSHGSRSHATREMTQTDCRQRLQSSQPFSERAGSQQKAGDCHRAASPSRGRRGPARTAPAAFAAGPGSGAARRRSAPRTAAPPLPPCPRVSRPPQPPSLPARQTGSVIVLIALCLLLSSSPPRFYLDLPTAWSLLSGFSGTSIKRQ